MSPHCLTTSMASNRKSVVNLTEHIFISLVSEAFSAHFTLFLFCCPNWLISIYLYSHWLFCWLVCYWCPLRMFSSHLFSTLKFLLFIFYIISIIYILYLIIHHSPILLKFFKHALFSSIFNNSFSIFLVILLLRIPQRTFIDWFFFHLCLEQTFLFFYMPHIFFWNLAA
jgi:hypothetical protein